MLLHTGKKNIRVRYPQICSRRLIPLSHFILWQLHLNIYVLL